MNALVSELLQSDDLAGQKWVRFQPCQAKFGEEFSFECFAARLAIRHARRTTYLPLEFFEARLGRSLLCRLEQCYKAIQVDYSIPGEGSDYSFYRREGDWQPYSRQGTPHSPRVWSNHRRLKLAHGIAAGGYGRTCEVEHKHFSDRCLKKQDCLAIDVFAEIHILLVRPTLGH